ncbi:MAG TPA: tetratricopeptide repeat protein [Bryobacterales bacterium]|nr:tetratricopeptide repeat protein [Bryobacterales bacterium]
MPKTAAAAKKPRREALEKPYPAKLSKDQAQTVTSWHGAAVVAAITLAVFWPAIGNQFVNWDDDKNFLNNPYFRGLTLSHLRWMFTTSLLGHYHPFTWITLGLDYVLWGMNPAGYHLTNILLHAANAVLLYLIALRLLGGRIWVAVLAALLFSVHPLRVESVAWVTERRDVLSGFFYLLSVLTYLRAQRPPEDGPSSRTREMALSAAFFAAGLLSKVIVASLPLVLLLLDAYPLRRGFRLAEKIPYFLFAAAGALAALATQGAGVHGFAEHVVLLPGLRTGLSLYGLFFYLWKTVLPFGLYPQYVLPAGISVFDRRIVLAAALAAALTITAVVLRRRLPAFAAVWACYVVTLLPVLSFARLDTQQYAADHNSYLATLGLALAGAAAIAAIRRREIARAAAPLLILIFAMLCRRQIPVWRDPSSLWTATLAGAPDSVVAHNNLGEALAAQGRLGEAAAHFRRAIEIRPGYAQAHYNLARASQKQGDLPGAIAEFQRALQIEPAFATAHNDLATCYAALGQSGPALEQYRLALRYQPDYADAHYNLGNLLQQQRQLEDSIAEYRQALRYNPGLADAHNNWGVALDALGRPAEAMEHYRQALLIAPTNSDAHNNLGAALEAQGKKDEAVAEYRQALRFNPGHRDAAANLARALRAP